VINAIIKKRENKYDRIVKVFLTFVIFFLKLGYDEKFSIQMGYLWLVHRCRNSCFYHFLVNRGVQMKCPDFDEDFIYVKNKKRKICGHWDLDNHGMCTHENHSVCLYYFEKKGIEDPWLIHLMNEFGAVLC
jgi:hypothetical protein